VELRNAEIHFLDSFSPHAELHYLICCSLRRLPTDTFVDGSAIKRGRGQAPLKPSSLAPFLRRKETIIQAKRAILCIGWRTFAEEQAGFWRESFLEWCKTRTLVQCPLSNFCAVGLEGRLSYTVRALKTHWPSVCERV
jgi:hypothetical protein